MAKAKRRPAFEIAGQKVAAGERRTISLPAPDLYTHTGLEIPVHIIHGRRDGPVLFLSGAVHGDEIIGVEIIRRVLASKQLKSLRGTVIAIPVVNIFGFINQIRYLPDRRDLNRVFPGSETGSLASRLAGLFTREILARSTHGIDLHTAAINRENLPQIRAVMDDDVTIAMATAFGLPVILNTRIIEGSLRETAENLGVKVIVYEAGEALRFDEYSIRGGVHGVISVMRSIGILRKRQPGKSKEPFVAKRSAWTRAPQSGIHRSIAALGSVVKRGDVLGYITDPLGGNEAEVVAPGRGIIIGRTAIPLVTEGEALFHIASFEESPNQVAEVLDETQQMLDENSGENAPEEPPIV